MNLLKISHVNQWEFNFILQDCSTIPATLSINILLQKTVAFNTIPAVNLII
jgi:hypothetical protein